MTVELGIDVAIHQHEGSDWSWHQVESGNHWLKLEGNSGLVGVALWMSLDQMEQLAAVLDVAIRTLRGDDDTDDERILLEGKSDNG